MIVTVWSKVSLPGFHYWPEAQGARAYLASRHRHLFGITAHVRVHHDDRDVEFHDLGDAIRDWWGPGARELGSSSCETIASDLWWHLEDRGLEPIRIEASEDGESGAVVERLVRA